MLVSTMWAGGEIWDTERMLKLERDTMKLAVRLYTEKVVVILG